MGTEPVKVTVGTKMVVRRAVKDDSAHAATALQALKKATLFAVPATVFCAMVWVLLRGYRYTPAQVAHAVRALMQVRNVVCNAPGVLAGLALLEAGGDFADGVIAFEGELLGAEEFLSFDQQAVKQPKGHKRRARLLKAGGTRLARRRPVPSGDHHR